MHFVDWITKSDDGRFGDAGSPPATAAHVVGTDGTGDLAAHFQPRSIDMPNPDPVDPAQDALIRQMRDQIVDNDLKLMLAVNKRLELVATLRRYKESQGLEFVDHSREEWMHRYLQGANRGPLSRDGLTEIYGHLLELTKRETARANG